MTEATIPSAGTDPRAATSPPNLLSWWTGELRSLIPARLMSWLVGDVAIIDVLVNTNEFSLLKSDAGKRVAYATVPAASAAGHPSIRELIAKGGGHVRVLLDASQVLTKTITLPAATEENLREVMGFELDRHTPFIASQVYYDVRVIGRDSQRETIEVLLAVVARTMIDGMLGALRAAGLSVEAIGVVAEEGVNATIDLLPAHEKPPRKWGNLLRINLALMGAIVLLGLLATLLPIWQKREAVIALIPVVEKTSAEFQQNQRLFEEYTKLANEYNYVTGKKQGAHPTLAVIEELTRISPDTTVVQNFDLKLLGKTREVTLIGEAQAASKVIEALEQSPMFQNASQKSNTRRGSQGTNEWYHIATELKPKPLPAAVAAEVALLPAPTAPATPAAPAPVPVTAQASVPAEAAGKSGGLPPQPVPRVDAPPPAQTPGKPQGGNDPVPAPAAPRKQP
ncbi:MAG: pilus assembly protein PilM [Betaproteobacteria bacterium]|nr:pilus assembly protein PilM [Betaproteobacteria bacterium]